VGASIGQDWSGGDGGLSERRISQSVASGIAHFRTPTYIFDCLKADIKIGFKNGEGKYGDITHTRKCSFTSKLITVPDLERA
jgi:hypothetical protein